MLKADYTAWISKVQTFQKVLEYVGMLWCNWYLPFVDLGNTVIIFTLILQCQFYIENDDITLTVILTKMKIALKSVYE